MGPARSRKNCAAAVSERANRLIVGDARESAGVGCQLVATYHPNCELAAGAVVGSRDVERGVRPLAVCHGRHAVCAHLGTAQRLAEYLVRLPRRASAMQFAHIRGAPAPVAAHGVAPALVQAEVELRKTGRGAAASAPPRPRVRQHRGRSATRQPRPTRGCNSTWASAPRLRAGSTSYKAPCSDRAYGRHAPSGPAQRPRRARHPRRSRRRLPRRRWRESAACGRAGREA